MASRMKKGSWLHIVAAALLSIACGETPPPDPEPNPDPDPDPTPPAFVSAGGHHTCGLNRSGEVWCWGRNQFGELGVTGDETAVHSCEGQRAAVTGQGHLHGRHLRLGAADGWLRLGVGEQWRLRARPASHRDVRRRLRPCCVPPDAGEGPRSEHGQHQRRQQPLLRVC
jgi:hypothetical protein